LKFSLETLWVIPPKVNKLVKFSRWIIRSGHKNQLDSEQSVECIGLKIIYYVFFIYIFIFSANFHVSVKSFYGKKINFQDFPEFLRNQKSVTYSRDLNVSQYNNTFILIFLRYYKIFKIFWLILQCYFYT